MFYNSRMYHINGTCSVVEVNFSFFFVQKNKCGKDSMKIQTYTQKEKKQTDSSYYNDIEYSYVSIIIIIIVIHSAFLFDNFVIFL